MYVQDPNDGAYIEVDEIEEIKADPDDPEQCPKMTGFSRCQGCGACAK